LLPSILAAGFADPEERFPLTSAESAPTGRDLKQQHGGTIVDKRCAWRFFAVALVSLTALAGSLPLAGAAEAQGRQGVSIANGPFSYDPANAGSTTFLGEFGGPAMTSFRVCAPGGGTIFPAGGSTAVADISVFGVEQVADADGVALAEPVKVPLDSSLGGQIAGAFALAPQSHIFAPGSCVDVGVTVSNPMVAPAEFGDYVVTMKAQAIGSGIGVGSGSRYGLSLRPATVTDITPPTVVIDSPADGSTHLLGLISVQIRANDPVPGTGVTTIVAGVASAGGTVTEPVILVADTPQPAGSDATATGSFNPTGASGPAGTTALTAFTGTVRSGIGTYILAADATDGAGNVGMADSTFHVKYDVAFTMAAGQINNGQPANSFGRFHFSVRRSSVTSDAAFMFDQTVVVKLVRTSDSAVVASHVFGTGAITAFTQIDETVPEYKTHFKRGDIGAASSATYKAQVWFLDVDGVLVQQGESPAVTF
jgi:hypothetical protein